MKKAFGILILCGVVLAIGGFAITAFTKPSAPARHTVREAAQRLISQYGPGFAAKGTTINGTKCIVVVNGKAVPTPSPSTPGDEFVCAVSLANAKGVTACQGVDFAYPASATDVKIKGAQMLPAKDCA